jgi:hypothetical protein
MFLDVKIFFSEREKMASPANGVQPLDVGTRGSAWNNPSLTAFFVALTLSDTPCGSRRSLWLAERSERAARIRRMCSLLSTASWFSALPLSGRYLTGRPLRGSTIGLRVVILEENRPQECGKRMRAPATVNYSLARRPRRGSSNNGISKNDTLRRCNYPINVCGSTAPRQRQALGTDCNNPGVQHR